MPQAAPRPCAAPRCPALVTGPESRCPAHARPAWATTRGSATARGYGQFWRGARLGLLMAEPLCRACAAEGRVEVAREVDHIVPKARGGTDEATNLQPLCVAHHRSKTARESA